MRREPGLERGSMPVRLLRTVGDSARNTYTQEVWYHASTYGTMRGIAPYDTTQQLCPMFGPARAYGAARAGVRRA
eukprot:6345508-Prymnesium_polylepis.1